MRKLMSWLAVAGLINAPIEAKAAQFEEGGVRTGAFVGARFQMKLGGRAGAKPRASLAIAPTLGRTSTNREFHTSIGEGAALNFNSRPTLTIMGVRADEALGIRASGPADVERKLGVSSGGWAAIGLGVVALAGGVYFLHVLDEAEDNSD